MAVGFNTTSAYGSRQVTPDKGMSRQATPRVRVSKFGDGYEQRLTDGLNPIAETWQVTFNNRSYDEIDDITGFFASLKGATSFNLTIPDETAGGERIIKVVVETYTQNYNFDGFYSASATLRRVYEA